MSSVPLLRTPGSDPHPRVSKPSPQRILVAVMCACVVLVVGTVASVNLAVPLLATSGLHPSASALIWIVDLYVVLFACLVIPGGAAGDRFGRKGVLVVGLVVFAVGAVVSAAAPAVTVLFVGRALSGLGAAAVLPNTLAVLLHAVDPDRRGATIATWASMTGIGGVIGNVGGGAVLTGGSWRWLFVSVVPVAVVAAGLVARYAPVSARHDRALDPVGAVLLVAASVALLVGIVQGPESGWSSPVVVVGFAGALGLFAVWAVVELRVEHPLLDPRLFRLARLRSASLGLTVVFVGLFGLFYVNASFLQYVLGFGVLGAGAATIPLSVPIILGGRHVGRLSSRVGANATLTLAFASTGGGLFGLSTTGAHPTYPVYAVWLVVTGVGITLALPTLAAAVADSLPTAQAGVGAGLQATTREFGSALGVAVVGSVITSRFVAGLPASVRAEGDPHTVAQALAGSPPGSAHAVVAAFAAAVDTGLRVIGVVVLVVGVLVVLEAAWSGRHAKS